MKPVIEFLYRLEDGGGIETIVRTYAETMDRNVVSLIILTLFPNTTGKNHIAIARMGIPIISLYPKYNIFFRTINKVLGKQITSFLLKKRIAQLQPCAIHVHLAKLTYLESIKSSIKNVRLFYTCHCIPDYYLSGSNKKMSAKTLIKKNKLQVIALHEEMAVELNRLLGINNTIVIKNGINIGKFRNVKESKQEIRKSLNIPTNAYVVGHVGRFRKVKNHTFLIDIFVHLLQHRNAHLVLVGDGKLLPMITDKIKRLGLEKKVTILTHRNDINRLLKTFDVFLFPSLHEGTGIALLEAQAAGLRCIISDTIPVSARILDTTIAVSLDKSPEYWCKIILNEKLTQAHSTTLNDYDIHQIVKRLQNMYIG